MNIYNSFIKTSQKSENIQIKELIYFHAMGCARRGWGEEKPTDSAAGINLKNILLTKSARHRDKLTFSLI